VSLAERYEILGVIARGNMGVVYRARDRRLGRHVALKQILGGESEEDRARFLREAEVVARLNHPHIVALHAYGEEGGHPWLVLEYLEGETLTERLRRSGPLSARQIVEVGAALAEALDHAHQVGVLHRDLKPDNVILVEGRPYVVDFGLARLVSRATRLTATNDLIGTPAYMSPEQAQGEHEQVGVASDLYGLAGTLYFGLTGRAPITGSTLLDTLQKIVGEIPPPAGSGAPLLDQALARGLAKDPSQRYASGVEFAEALRASTSGGLAPGSAPARRRSPALLGALLLVPLVAVLAAAAIYSTRPESREASRAEAPPPVTTPKPPRAPSAPPATPSPAPPLAPSPSSSPPIAPNPGQPLPQSASAAALQVRELALALQLREARAVLAKARERWPRDDELRVWTTAWLHARLGAWESARPAFEEAVRLDSTRAERLARLPGPRPLYPYGSDLRLLGQQQEGNSLPFEGRWTPWLGGRWTQRGEVCVASGTGMGTYNLSVALDEEAPLDPKILEVQVRLAPLGEHGEGYAGIFFGGQNEREFFCLFLVDSPGDQIYQQVGGAEAYRRRAGALPVFARMTHQRGDRWEFPMTYSKVVPQRSEWLRLGLRFVGTQAKVFIDDRQVAEVELGREPKGRCGLLKFYSVPIEFRGWQLR
jgi:serine/threonine protein kinase